MQTIRTTDKFRLLKNEKNYHFIECLMPNVVPRVRRIGKKEATQLESVSNQEFDTTSNIGYGVGVFQKPQ